MSGHTAPKTIYGSPIEDIHKLNTAYGQSNVFFVCFML